MLPLHHHREDLGFVVFWGEGGKFSFLFELPNAVFFRDKFKVSVCPLPYGGIPGERGVRVGFVVLVFWGEGGKFSGMWPPDKLIKVFFFFFSNYQMCFF